MSPLFQMGCSTKTAAPTVLQQTIFEIPHAKRNGHELSGQCFLAFAVHEAKKFLEEQQIRSNKVNLGRCLRAIFHEDVANIFVYTIISQRLHTGRDLARTQCLHDHPFPAWISFIAERVLLSPYLSATTAKNARIRDGLSVLLCKLDLHSSLILSDAARQRLASGPWSKKYMKIARRMAKRRRQLPRVTQTGLPNPLTVHAPPRAASWDRNILTLIPKAEDNEDGSSAVYNSEVARQHLELLRSSDQPEVRIQVFRNGAPHSLYATETLLREEIRLLAKRREDQRASLQVTSKAPPKITDAESSPEASDKHICILDRVRAKFRWVVQKCRRNKHYATPQLQAKSRTQAAPQSRAEPAPQPQIKVKPHKGPPEEQEAALKELHDNILDLQNRKKLYNQEYEWLQESHPRLASVAVPSKTAVLRQWKKEQARSPVANQTRKIWPSIRGGASAEESQNVAHGSSEQPTNQDHGLQEPTQNRDHSTAQQSQNRAGSSREQSQTQDHDSPEQDQAQSQSAPRTPSDNPPTYAQSERDSQSRRNSSLKPKSKFGEKWKRLLRRVGIKKKNKNKKSVVEVPRGRSQSPRV